MIELAKIPPEGLRSHGQADQIELDEINLVRNVVWEIFLQPSNKDYFFEIRVQGAWEGVCGRCLAPLDQTLQNHAQFLLSPDPQLVARSHALLGKQDLDVVFHPDPFLDELEYVREHLELELPMQPLCSPECKGLCPQCGKNWNKGPCSCASREAYPDNPLSRALAQLKFS